MSRRLLLALVVLLVVAALGRRLANAPTDSRSGDRVRVEVRTGMGVRDIARTLHAAGLVRSPSGFVLLTYLRNARDKLQAGVYEFFPGESGSRILARLISGDAVAKDVAVTIPEGFTLRQIAERLEASGIVSHEIFLEAAVVARFRSEFPALLGSAPGNASLEGYLFPDTYRFEKETAPEEAIHRMVRRFAEKWEEAKGTVCSEQGTVSAHCALLTVRSVREFLTMASIVEREVRSSEDRGLVSGILWKRFDAGVGLDADATIRYALNDWESPLTVDNLRIDSPYNTRRYRGLPPGPIGNPGLESLWAVLAPSASPYLYYLSARDGKTIFSKTLDEHNRAKAQYLTPGPLDGIPRSR